MLAVRPGRVGGRRRVRDRQARSRHGRVRGDPGPGSSTPRPLGTDAMQADAYRRARKLLSSSSPNVLVKAGFLGVVHSLLVLALLGIAGLLAGLLDSRGETRYPTDQLSSLPLWMARPVAG